MSKGKTIAVVGGSYDPMTLGHTYVVKQSSRMFDEVHIVIGVNPTKKYLFSAQEREELARDIVKDLDIKGTPVHFHYLKDRLLIQLATDLGATHLVRGLRSSTDFEYERQMALVNRKINPLIETIYVGAPPELTEISSTTVKGLVGFEDWKAIVGQYVHPKVLDALTRKHLTQKIMKVEV